MSSEQMRLLLLLLGGLGLGLLMALALFGSTLFDLNGAAANGAAPALQQVPRFDTVTAGTRTIHSGTGLLRVGDSAYDFTLSDLDGAEYTLSALRGRPLILNFWATWCAPCRVEMPELQAAYEQYAAEELVILAIDQQEPADVVRAFFYDEMGLTFTPLLDSRGEVAQRYSVFHFPSTYFIDAEGVITAIHRGPMVRSQIEEYLALTIPAS